MPKIQSVTKEENEKHSGREKRTTYFPTKRYMVQKYSEKVTSSKKGKKEEKDEKRKKKKKNADS